MRDFAPVYGEVSLGSAIESADKAFQKIKSNKFDKQDLIDLVKANTNVIIAIIENEQEN